MLTAAPPNRHDDVVPVFALERPKPIPILADLQLAMKYGRYSDKPKGHGSYMTTLVGP